jgi:hypothetical protein
MVAARPFIEKNFHPTVVVGGYFKVKLYPIITEIRP